VSAERRDVPAVVEATASVKAATLRHALAVPAVIAGAGDHAARRFLEFFAATIRNKNTRMAYYRAACRFFAWVERHEIGELAAWLWCSASDCHVRSAPPSSSRRCGQARASPACPPR
jgi:hypothetical protein